MHSGGVTRPGHDQATPLQQQAPLAAHTPAVIREPLLPDLPEAAAFPYGMDRLDPIRVNDTEQGESRQEGLCPRLMGHEEAKETRPLRQAGNSGR